VWAVIQGFGAYWTLVASVELGVFDGIERLGPTRVEPLAEQLDASAVHLRHVLDALVTYGFLDQVGDVYELTETAERYLCTGGAASMASLVRVAPGPHDNWERLADTVRSGTVASPIEDDAASFYRPLVAATFATQLRAATRLGLRLGWGRRGGLRALDVGAGRAPWTVAVLQLAARSTAVVNDLPEVLDDAAAVLAEHGLSERVQLLPGDFHAIEIADNEYDLVVLGHVCRTEGDAGAASLVRRAFRALRPGGTVLIADYFADNDRKHNPFGVQMGLTMLANTRHGGAITNEQVARWLGDAGFEAVRLLEPIGFNFVYVATRPRGASE
jgi:SAM-dependent methyltransferase